MLHGDTAGWQSHRHSTHDRLMDDTSMGQYAKHREALRASRNAALHMGRSHDVMMLDSWPRDPTSSRSVERAVAPVPRVVGGLGAAEPLQFPHATPSPLAAAYAGYDATFSGPDGTRHDPRFVDARHRPSDAEVAYLRRELSDEQRRLLALEEQLGQHKAREGRIARTVDSALSGYSPPTPSTLGELAPTVGGGYELESIYSAMRAQQWEIEALARECRGLTHMRRMPQTQLVQMYPPMVGPALGSAVNPGGLRVTTDGPLYAPNPAPYNGLQTREQRQRAEATAARKVAWASPTQSRATGNRWVIEELAAQEHAARQRGTMLDREIDEYSRQLEMVKKAKEEAAAATRTAFGGTDEMVRAEYPLAV